MSEGLSVWDLHVLLVCMGFLRVLLFPPTVQILSWLGQMETQNCPWVRVWKWVMCVCVCVLCDGLGTWPGCISCLSPNECWDRVQQTPRDTIWKLSRSRKWMNEYILIIYKPESNQSCSFCNFIPSGGTVRKKKNHWCYTAGAFASGSTLKKKKTLRMTSACFKKGVHATVLSNSELLSSLVLTHLKLIWCNWVWLSIFK